MSQNCNYVTAVLDTRSQVRLLFFGDGSRHWHGALHAWRKASRRALLLFLPPTVLEGGSCTHSANERPYSWSLPSRPRPRGGLETGGNRGNQSMETAHGSTKTVETVESSEKKKELLFFFMNFHGFHGFRLSVCSFHTLVSTVSTGFHQQGHLGSSAWLVRGGSAWPDPAGQVRPCEAVGGGLHVARDSVRPRLPSALPSALPMRRKRDLRQ